MLSANHLNQDMGVEIYMLDRSPDYDARTWQAAAEVTSGDRRPAT